MCEWRCSLASPLPSHPFSFPSSPIPANLQRQEGLAEAVAAVGCDMCHHSDQGCRLCWPIAVEVAQKAHAALLPGQRVVMPASPPGPARGAKKDKKGAGGKAAASSPDAVAASVSPAAAAAAAAAASASTRRNKLLLKVQHDTVTAAHEAGKTALGCGRCRYSMTGGCNNCRAKEAEKLVGSCWCCCLAVLWAGVEG